MYMALRELNVRLPDLTVATIAPGQEVPGFGDWKPWTQKAMLEQHMVRWAPDGMLAPHESAKAAKVVIQHLPSGPLGPPVDAGEKVLEPTLYKPAEPDVPQSAMVVDGDAPVAKAAPIKQEVATTEAIFKKANAPLLNDGVQVSTAVAKKGAHDCTVCGKQGFKDFNGLRIHMAKAHKQ